MPIYKRKKVSGMEEDISDYFEDSYTQYLDAMLDNNVSPNLIKKALKIYFKEKLAQVDDTVDYIYSDDY